LCVGEHLGPRHTLRSVGARPGALVLGVEHGPESSISQTQAEKCQIPIDRRCLIDPLEERPLPSGRSDWPNNI
jgi:hypothetical protein